mmetsp:Transcript_1239/g.1932  ORF Transcript_1239/g.1932 Transcript_1239/m.1932 type:complete len:126 (+) Transcript_1239:587-964(+)
MTLTGFISFAYRVICVDSILFALFEGKSFSRSLFGGRMFTTKNTRTDHSDAHQMNAGGYTQPIQRQGRLSLFYEILWNINSKFLETFTHDLLNFFQMAFVTGDLPSSSNHEPALRIDNPEVSPSR